MTYTQKEVGGANTATNLCTNFTLPSRNSDTVEELPKRHKNQYLPSQITFEIELKSTPYCYVLSIVQISPLTVTPSGHGKSVTVTRLSL